MARRVILVEDDEDVRELLHVILDSEGFDVTALGHPRLLQALDPQSAPALFLIDLMLPGTSGIEAARRLQGRGFTTPIIGISASRLMLEVAAGSGLFAETVYKPFDLNELVECVQQAIAAQAGSRSVQY
jgi:two-component system response regulator MtrA